MALSLLHQCVKSLPLTSAHVECAVQTLVAYPPEVSSSTSAGSTEKARSTLNECQQTLETRFTQMYLTALIHLCEKSTLPVAQREACLDKLTSAFTTLSKSALQAVA